MTRRTAIGAGAAVFATPLFGQGSAPIANTEQGTLIGGHADGALYFKGIPYAGPTPRFRKPTSPVTWIGLRDATQFGPPSPQLAFSPSSNLGPVPPAEACQNLNIWTPRLDDARRPVMVWLHGGGFQAGTANLPHYDGAKLASAQQVVVVTVNHRLGALGQLWLEHIDPAYAGAGAAGFLDIAVALQWINRNIHAFGGDPDRVTIFGQSGGGGKVLTLMAMRDATPFFHRAICQSGSMLRTAITPDEAAAQTAALFVAAGLEQGDIAGLVGLPIEELNEAQSRASSAGRPHPVWPLPPSQGEWRPYSAVIDGHHLSQDPFAAHAPPESAHIPLMIGSTTMEGRSYSRGLPHLYDLDDAGLVEELGKLLEPDVVGPLIELYREARPDASASDLFFQISADAMYWAGSLRVADNKAQVGAAPVYMYRFAYDPDEQGSGVTTRAGHGQEIQYIFGNLTAQEEGNPSAQRLAEQMSSAWAAFAREGVPSVPGADPWLAYRPELPSTMIFDTATRLEMEHNQAERSWWRNNDYGAQAGVR